MESDERRQRAPLIEIIAEAANGHDGDHVRLLSLVEYGIAAGADGVKFQLVFADEICTRDHGLFEHFRSKELPDEAWEQAAAATRAAGRRFYLDVFGPRSAGLAERIGADGVKLHATDLANHELLRIIAGSGVDRVLVGTGGAFRAEIRTAVELLGNKSVVLLHGFQSYPTPNEDNQIGRIVSLGKEFPETAVGFADHVSPSDPATTWLSAVAVGAGATVIEKHLTTARVLRAVDHEAALNPDDFAAFVANMRTAEAAQRTGDVDAADYGMSAAEYSYRALVRKSLVAARDLRAGQTLTSTDLTLKRSPREEATSWTPADVAGRTLSNDVAEGDPIHEGVLVGADQ